MSNGVLRVVGGAGLAAEDQAQAAADTAAAAAQSAATDLTGLASYIRDQFYLMRYHRDDAGAGWAERLLRALRAFNGQYDPTKLAEMRKFGGSEVYARITAMKCRGASSLLRDVYLGSDRPWGLAPDPDPEIPDTILAAISTLIQAEVASAKQGGKTVDSNSLRDRQNQLLEAARQAAKSNEATKADIAEDKVEEMLQEGNFYNAFAEFLVDLAIFPYACIKGPTVRIKSDVKWKNGQATMTEEPRLVWERISPFDIYWTPGVHDIADANIIERGRLTRKDINDLLDLPGYNVDEVRAVLDEYGRGGLYDDYDQTDSERAVQENREDPHLNRSGMIAYLEFQGYAQGRMLLEAGMDASLIADELRDYFVQAWLIGRHVVKVQLAPSPRKRHQYYVTSFEKVPGTIAGNGLPDILEDTQSICNATLRALVNNMSIASGPQVVIMEDRLADGENGNDMYPWKRWKTRSSPIANNTEEPIKFFMPTSISQELLGVYAAFAQLADEQSAIPRFMTGSSAPGNVGRTASGLSMLMSNSSKLLQTVAANVDRDVLRGCITGLLDMILLTDTSGLLSGQEEVRVLGVTVAVQKETQRSRQLEFLQITANPIDVQIMGPKGRATILREVSKTLGIPGDDIVPSADQLNAQQKQAATVAQQNNQPGHGGMGQQAAAAQGNQQGSQMTQDQGPRTNTVGTTIQGGP